MKNCPKCGIEMDDSLELCPNCSADVEAQDTQMQAEEAQDTPMQTEEAPAAEVRESEAAPQDTPCSDAPHYSDLVLAPKKNKKKIALIAAAVLAIAAAIACILIFCKPSPEDAVKDAYDMTGDQLDDIFAKAPNLNDALSVTSDLLSGNKLSLGLDLDGSLQMFADEQLSNTVPFDFSVSLSSDIDTKENIQNGSFSLYAGIGANKTHFDFLYSFDSDTFIFQMPKYVDGSYGFAFTDDLADRIVNSYLYKSTSLGEFFSPLELKTLFAGLSASSDSVEASDADESASFTAAFDKLKESFTYEASDKTLPKCDGLDIYKVGYDKDAFEDVSAIISSLLENSDSLSPAIGFSRSPFPRELKDILQNSDVDIYVGIDEKGRLASVTLYDDNDYFTLRLSGKDNVWNSFALYCNDATLINGGFKATKSGFSLRLVIIDYVGIVVSCNDKSGKLTYSLYSTDDDDEIYTLSFNYELIAKKTGVEYSFSLDVPAYGGLESDVTLTLKPLNDEVGMLDSSYSDIFDFTKEEYQDFILSLIDGMYGGALSRELGDAFTYENIFGDPDVEYYD